MSWSSATKRLRAADRTLLLLKNNMENKIVDVAIPGDVRICEKELDKIEKYKP